MDAETQIELRKWAVEQAVKCSHCFRGANNIGENVTATAQKFVDFARGLTDDKATDPA